ncbi:uncharacterized protein [Apostichopus japonicus]|uniref:uncharacterized protein isoform X1 n=1 Tax=Stichopus japonicus TaxID=307972 RepID=UPI003AB63FCE
MATLSLVLVFVFIAGISGQPSPLPSIIYYDIGTRIDSTDGTTVTPAVNSAAVSSDRKSCFDGTDFYYTEGNSVFKYPDTDTPIYTVPAELTLKSIACRCNLLAVSLCDDSDNTFVNIITTNPVEDVIDRTFGVEGRAAIEFSTDGDCFFIVSTILKTRIYDCNKLAEASIITDDITLERQPRCIASYQDDATDDVYIFVTFDTQTNAQLLIWNGAGTITVSSITVFTGQGLAPQAARVSCVDVADDFVYFLIATSVDDDNTQYELSRYPIAPWLAGTQNERDGIMPLETGNDGIIDGDVNGLSVCGSACIAACAPVACGCSTIAPFCGFCFDDAGGGTCQCANSATPNCADPDPEGECRDPIPRIDACCLVKNPLALRRSGGSVDVVGVTTVAGTIDVGRAARTGRWLKLPIHTVKSNAVSSPYYEGFSAAVPPQSRGRRFGVFQAHFNPTDENLLEEWIPCIATENSGFVNTLYTYTISRDQSVSLGAEFVKNRLDRFEPSLRWRCTTFDAMGNSNAPVPVPSCDGSLVCTLSGSGLSDSIYEVYRPGREKRTWHPLFYLFVRNCDDGFFCDGGSFPCPTCVNGVCDDVNGLCNCYPGFTGDTCEDACPEGRIGKGCSYLCSEVFPGSDCSNILICNPGKVGCKCYPGLQAPDCITPCDAGFWGSNCHRTCTAPCNPRTGL